MASQLLDEHAIESSESLLPRDTPPGAAWAPLGPEPCDLPSNLDLASEAVFPGEDCPRGILIGVSIEIVVGLVLYAGWHALHLVR